MKNFIQVVVLLFCITAFSQEQKVDYKKIDNNLVQVTYYFADNNTIIEKEGFFNKAGKLHGTWISYDINGNKTTIANYNDGTKEGVWMYFKGDKVNVVTYANNKITNVEERALAVN
jgi:antitoxin component YwqK of YwqJK toxin-antitoxin module